MRARAGVLLCLLLVTWARDVTTQSTLHRASLKNMNHLKHYVTKLMQHSQHQSIENFNLRKRLRTLEVKVTQGHKDMMSALANTSKQLAAASHDLQQFAADSRTRSNELQESLDDTKMDLFSIRSRFVGEFSELLTKAVEDVTSHIVTEIQRLHPDKPRGQSGRSVRHMVSDQPQEAGRGAGREAGRRNQAKPHRGQAGGGGSKNKQRVMERESDLGMPVRDMETDYTDCEDVLRAGHRQDGTYLVRPANVTSPFYVRCELDTHGRAWTVLQHRHDGSTNFYRGWADYRDGFGSLKSEFYLGNARIHALTSQANYKLRVRMYDWRVSAERPKGNKYIAYAGSVYIDREDRNFALHIPTEYYAYTGYSASGLRVHRGPFCTYDRNNLYGRENCAQRFHCGWWFSACVTNSNLNGRYYQDGYKSRKTGERGEDDLHWPNINQSLREVSIAIQRKQDEDY